MPDHIEHPGYGAYYESSDTGSDAGLNPHRGCRLKTGFVCKECGESVLAYTQPKKCEEHE